MSTNIPPTIWASNDGESEFTQTGNPSLDTEAGFDLTDEAGNTIVIEDVARTPIQPTIWVEDDSK